RVSVSSRSLRRHAGSVCSEESSRSSVSSIGHLRPGDIDAVLAIDFGEADVDRLEDRGGDVLADEVGTDGKFAVAAIDEDREADAGGPAEIEQGIERGPDAPAGEKHVVDEDDGCAVDVGWHFAGAKDGCSAAAVEVVAVEADIEAS